MSSFLGHTLAAITIDSLAKPYNSKPHLRVWLGWLVLIALAPDIDYIVPILHPSSHQGMRITHSIFSSLLLPLSTMGILLIELGILTPLFSSILITSKGYDSLEKQKIIVPLLLFISACFMTWAFNLSR
ncbi:hypothetical protein [Limnofasciculus baicalensis]|uniref:Metal-dependent hydrolase n=1 Tax=Limnofasciculus baicalensis BBK-W-15 TaxID=2699891 RepID=A0AAE3GQ10_9CYAN|nr:hypothetical protein [Limnofasciculus baicalensis]MCP2727947.1 hypothetical protein [Limnofasciculus baicalensis BBK-W-15]